ncbi:hypothetical protein NGRA_2629 [Nosema granulosis]|uniref:Uncharacterized protein n=1 Tax=Nosema granulosis TaxID=83296 RepID=A0A9P6GW92_9MICR|nr:hypothetical protein NGRA_2629 [Nosema granulosis]
MSEEYVLCSSSTEEGEICEIKSFEPVPNLIFPRTISSLKDWYLPHTQHLIGPNTIPRSSDYPSGASFIRVKKKVRKDMLQAFNIISLNKDKAFFNNKFEIIEETTTLGNSAEDFKLARVFDDKIKTIKKLEHIHGLSKNEYGAMCDIFPFDDRKHEVVPNIVEYPSCKKFILLRDSIVDKIDIPDVFIFFRVIKSRKGTTYVFEDSYFRRIKLYEYLDLYFEELLRSISSSEIRTYVNKDTFLAVFSSSVFTKEDYLYRYYDGVDVEKNFLAVINKDSVEITKRNLMKKSNFEYFLNLDLQEGDYAICNRKIYKLGVNGNKHEYDGLVFDDF